MPINLKYQLFDDEAEEVSESDLEEEGEKIESLLSDGDIVEILLGITQDEVETISSTLPSLDYFEHFAKLLEQDLLIIGKQSCLTRRQYITLNDHEDEAEETHTLPALDYFEMDLNQMTRSTSRPAKRLPVLQKNPIKKQRSR